MTPFQQFRLWARRAPTGERVATAVGAAVALALLVWVLVPAKNRTSQVVTTGTGPATAGAGAGGSSTATAAPGNATFTGGGSSLSTGAGGGPSATGGASAPSSAEAGQPVAAGGTSAVGSAGCVSPPGADQGITPTAIKLAVTLVNLIGPAGNNTFGVPSVAEQQLDYQQVIDSINASGGIVCRKLVPQFWTANPFDDTDRQQKCLDIVQARPFFVVDGGGYYGSPLSNCFPQHQLPFLGTGRLATSQRDQFYPYLFSTGAYETAYRNMTFALQARGFFSPANGFKKLGFLYRDCFGEITNEFLGWLHQVGVPSSQIVTYNFGCPMNFASPQDIEQAVLRFEEQGVTHVTESQFYPDFANFTKVAQQQGFKPKYGLADDGLVPISTSQGLNDDYNNIDGAIAITGDRYGEETTPGLSPTAGTQRCNAIFTAKGRPPVYQQMVGFGGVACDQLWMVQAAISHAPSLMRTALAAGLQASKTIDLSFPRGPADFSGPRVTYGGQFWRPEQFLKSCGCWRIVDATFKPSFP